MNHSLPLDLLRRIDEAASRFERRWSTPERVSIEQLLAEFPAESRSALLRELWPLEVELRRRGGEPLDGGEFERRFPHEAPPAAVFVVRAGDDATSLHVGGSHVTRPTGDYSRAADEEGAVLGPYTLERELGAGGMGVVWVARQSQPVKRRVALKLIKRGMDSRDVVRRFELERQALAVLDHPNIARVLDAGVTPDGRPFFAMELVNGLPLTKFCDESRLATRARLEIFQQICYAVQHAHQKGVIHRDLKPANILVTLVDGRPVPKVIDFGVAKALGVNLSEDSLTTRFGAVIGTLEYMAPEQAGYSGTDIDTRADIYALGVILYELLTGLRPFDAARFQRAALDEMIRVIREEQPSVPSKRLSTSDALPSLAAARQCEPQRLTRTLRGDLDWIAMKCLEKDRNRRYRTADQLADEVRRFLHDEPVEAGPPNQLYLLSKFVKRHRGRVLIGAALAMSLVIGLCLSLWHLRRAVTAETIAEAARATAVASETAARNAEQTTRHALAQAKVNEARGARRSRRVGGRTTAVAALRAARDIYRDLEAQGQVISADTWLELRSEFASAWLIPEIETELLPAVSQTKSIAHGVADFARGRILEFPGPRSSFVLRDLASGETLAECDGAIRALSYAEFSEDGNWLFTIGDFPRLEVWNLQGERPLSVWSKDQWQVAAHCRTHPWVVVNSGSKTATVYDRNSGREVYTGVPGTPCWGNPFAPDGRRIVLFRDGEMFIYDLETKHIGAKWSPPCESVRWSGTGDQILASVAGVELQLRDALTGNLLFSEGGFRGGLRGVIDGRQNLLFTHDWNRSAALRDARTGRIVLSLPFQGYSGELQMGLHSDRLDLLNQVQDRFVGVRLARGLATEFAPRAGHSPILSPDGSLLADTFGKQVLVYDVASGRLLEQWEHHEGCEAFAFDGNDALWVAGGWRFPSQAIRRKLIHKVESGLKCVQVGEIDRVCEAPAGAHWRAKSDRSVLAVGGDNDCVYLVRPGTDEKPATVSQVIQTKQQALRHTALSGDGKWVAAGGHVLGGIGVYDWATGQLTQMLSEQGGYASFSPHSDLIAIGHQNDRGALYRVAGWKHLYDLPGNSFCFSPAGNLLAVNAGVEGILILDSLTGESVLRLEIAESANLAPVHFTPDGNTLLATVTEPHRILKIDLGGIRRKLEREQLTP